MTLSVIVTVVIVAAGLYWLIRSNRKEAHHLDDLQYHSRSWRKKGLKTRLVGDCVICEPHRCFMQQ